MDPEERLLVIHEDFPVEVLVLLFGAVIGMFGPERMDLIDRLGTFIFFILVVLIILIFFVFPVIVQFDVLVAFFFFSRSFRGFVILLRHIHDLGDIFLCFFLLLGLIREIDLNRHEGTVLVQHVASPVLITEFITVLIQIEGDLGTPFLTVTGFHLEFRAAVALPVDRLCSF